MIFRFHDMTLRTSLRRFFCLSVILTSCVAPKRELADAKSVNVNALVRTDQMSLLAGTVGNSHPDAGRVNRLVIFGDSLSDPGNLHKRTLGTMLPPHVFYRSRFSNGPIWADYIQAPLKGWTIENFAVGGAKTSDDRVVSRFFIPSLEKQVDAFLKMSTFADTQSSLIAIWIGPNNYMTDGERLQDERHRPDMTKVSSYVDGVMKDFENAIFRLRASGFSNFIVGTMPELGVNNANPYEPSKVSSATLFAATASHNRALGNLVRKLKQIPSLRVSVFHSGELNQDTIENPQSWGFARLDRPCYVGSLRGKFYEGKEFCNDPGGYKFWEYIHPNTKMHCYYASQFLRDLQQDSLFSGFLFDEAIKRCKSL